MTHPRTDDATGQVGADGPLAGVLDPEAGWTGVLGIRLTEVGPDLVTASWPEVDPVLGQMVGFTAVVETTCSVGAAVWWGGRGRCVGMSNHTTAFAVSPPGPFTARAVPVDRGSVQQLWRCEVRGADGVLCASGEVLVANLAG